MQHWMWEEQVHCAINYYSILLYILAVYCAFTLYMITMVITKEYKEYNDKTVREFEPRPGQLQFTQLEMGS